MKVNLRTLDRPDIYKSEIDKVSGSGFFNRNLYRSNAHFFVETDSDGLYISHQVTAIQSNFLGDYSSVAAAYQPIVMPKEIKAFKIETRVAKEPKTPPAKPKEKSPKSKALRNWGLLNEIKEKILAAHQNGYSATAIAKMVGISEIQTKNFVSKLIVNHTPTKLGESQIADVKTAFRTGKGTKIIAAELGLSYYLVKQLVSGWLGMGENIRLSYENRIKIAQLADEGFTAEQIVEKLSLKIDLVTDFLKQIR